MAQQKKTVRKPAPANNKKPPVYNPKQEAKSSLFEGFNKWLDKRSSGIIIVSFALCLLFSLLLFQARMDIGGDDSGYILRAYDFVHKGLFPDYQGPLYPLILSIFIKMFGIKILLLKSLSVIFVFFSLFFLYKAFKNRLPSIVFYTVIFLTAINSYILSFASLTYSEACFLFLQSLTIFYFFKLHDKLKSLETFSLKETYPDFLLSALFVFLLSMSRSVGLFALPALLLFFIFRKEFKYALWFFCSFAAIEVVVGFIKKFVWHVATQWGAERSALLLKDQYNPSLGTETIAGFGNRLIGNSNLFLSKRFFQVIGLRSPDSLDVSGALTFFVILFCLFALYRAIKSKNEYILTITLYTGVMLVCTFLAIQTSIDQPRMVMVYVPFMLFMFLFAIYDGLKKAPWVGQSILLYVIIILVIAGSASVLRSASNNMRTLKKNFQGDLFYGFTPDWVNYIKMSQWCGDSLPPNSMVAARKADMSFIYTDKEMFYPIFKVYSNDPDTVLAFFKKHQVNYVMLASLRGNPKVADGNIVTTLWRMMQPVARKYPQKVKLVHQEGTSEPAYLYQINQ